MTRPSAGGAYPARVTVVGAGIAGVVTCEELRRLGYEGRLTLIGAERHLPYDRPPLSKAVLLGTAQPAHTLLKPEKWYADQDIALRLGERVQRIEPDEARVVVAGDRSEPADVIVLATGGTPRRLCVPGGDHPAITTLRTLTDAQLLKARLVPGARVGVVGAGLIGAEVTAAAVELGCAVTLIDPAPRPLEHVVGPEIAEALHAQHRARGVRVLTGAVTAAHDHGEAVRLRLDGSAPSVDCDVVVAGIGFDPDIALAAAAGLPTDRGVPVDDAQRAKHPRVFAVGDVARPPASETAMPSPGHWDAAREQGRTAAAIVGRPAPTRRAPWFWSERYETRLEVTGNFLGGDTTVIRGSIAAADFSAFAVQDGHCIGAVTLNRPRDMAAARRLIDRHSPISPGQLADESMDLRTLARR